jgi:hypothetical protein
MKFLVKHNKRQQSLPLVAGTVKNTRLFVHSLCSFLHKSSLHFVCPCAGRYMLSEQFAMPSNSCKL